MYPNNMAQVPPNYATQPLAMPMYPVSAPYQPPIAYPQNNVMAGAGTPLLNILNIKLASLYLKPLI